MIRHAWLFAPAAVAATLWAGPAAAQNKPKTIDQIRAECQAEYPPGSRYSDRSTLVSRCIQRKKDEAGKK